LAAHLTQDGLVHNQLREALGDDSIEVRTA
jgi:hypothetical protein